MELGLTFLQAKIYLTLCQVGSASIKTVYKNAEIARQDVYRVMPTLEELGLVERVLATPIMYKATAMKKGLHFLLDKKTKEIVEIKKKTEELIEEMQEVNNMPCLEEAQFYIISSERCLQKMFDERESNSQTSIEMCIDDWKFVRARSFYRLQEFKKALKRGVKIRILVSGQKDGLNLDKHIKELTMSPLFEIRYLIVPTVKMVIYDNNQMGLYVGTTLQSGVPSLWTNHLLFIKLMKSDFEEFWKNSKCIEEKVTGKTLNKKFEDKIDLDCDLFM
jgi:sugar-specific transcriptional regulator TrmB